MPRVKQAPKQRKKATAASGKAAKNNGSAAPAAILPPDSMTTMTTVVANGSTGHPVPAAQPPGHPVPAAQPPAAAAPDSSSDSSPSASGTQTPVHPKKRRGEAAKKQRAKALGVAATGKGAGKVTKTKKRMMSTLAKANALKKTAAAANGASEAPSAKKKRRWRQGTVALREIRRQQKSVELIIPDAPFMRLVREVISEGALAPASPQKITREAYLALKEGAESYLIDLFRDVQTSAVSHQRKGIFSRDLWLALRLRGELHKYPGVRSDTDNPEAAAKADS